MTRNSFVGQVLSISHCTLSHPTTLTNPIFAVASLTITTQPLSQYGVHIGEENSRKFGNSICSIVTLKGTVELNAIMCGCHTPTLSMKF